MVLNSFRHQEILLVLEDDANFEPIKFWPQVRHFQIMHD